MSQRDWWKGDLIASALLVLLFGISAAILWMIPAWQDQDVKPTSASNYQEALVVCEEWEETPWEVTNCKWNAYEAFYGTDAARAAYEHQVEAR
jgi:hypothetical protein